MGEAAATTLDAPPLRQRGYWGEALHTLARDWTALLGAALVLVIVGLALLAPVVAAYDPAFQPREGLTLEGEPRPPGDGFTLGTDPLGRDVLARLLHGARISLAVGIGANILSALIGVVIGGVAGMAAGRVQTLMMRTVDVVLSFPVLLLAIALLAVTEPNVPTIVVIVGVSFGAYLSRIVFTQVVSLREREFVLAARTAGVSRHTILVRHMIPHVLPAVTVYATLGVATAIQLEAALSFVGIGIQPPDPSWGNMISEGQSFLISSPWLIAFPGAAIIAAMLGFSLLGDGLRDALDPTLERRGRVVLGGVR